MLRSGVNFCSSLSAGVQWWHCENHPDSFQFRRRSAREQESQQHAQIFFYPGEEKLVDTILTMEHLAVLHYCFWCHYYLLQQMDRIFPWYKVKESKFWETCKVSSKWVFPMHLMICLSPHFDFESYLISLIRNIFQ